MLSHPAIATTLSVGPTQTHVTIQDALAVAVLGDVIEVDPGVYQGPIDATVEIVGLGGPGVTFLTAADPGPTLTAEYVAVSGFDIFNSVGIAVDCWDCQLDDIRIADMIGSSSPISSSTMVTISNSTFENNVTTGNGGAIDVAEGLWITDSTFTNNSATGRGGAIHHRGSLGPGIWTTTITRVTFAGNSAGIGGAIYHGGNDYYYSYTNMNVTESTFLRNNGGAIRTDGGIITGSTFVSNTGSSTIDCYGPIDYCYLDVSNSHFLENRPTYNLVNRGSVSDCTFIRNQGSVVARVEDSLFVASSPDGASAGDMVTGSTFIRSFNIDDGGAVDGAEIVESSLFIGNRSEGSGGAVSLGEWESAWGGGLTGNVFVRNTAHGSGGAVFEEPDGARWPNLYVDTEVSQNYVCENRAPLGAGMLLHRFGNTYWIDRNIFAANFGVAVGIDTVEMYTGAIIGGHDHTYNTFVANLGAGTYMEASSGGVANNIYASHPWVAHDATVEFGSDNLWWDNGIDSTSPLLPSATAVFVDPLLSGFSNDGNCFNDDFSSGRGGDFGAIAGGWQDLDGDGIYDVPVLDNCPDVANPSQLDSDGDYVGDACDPCPMSIVRDLDGDGFCPSSDVDGDGVEDGLDPCPYDLADDSDGDGVCDLFDECPGFDDRLDRDFDRVPDDCDACPDEPLGSIDTDGDGSCDGVPLCPGFDDNLDADGDGVPDGCDVCPLDMPDDSDGDGVCDSSDACPGEDDVADADADAVPDACDNCVTTPNFDQVDTDYDGVGNACDICAGPDADSDGVQDDCDICPLGDDTIDGDADGTPDACDACPIDALDDSDGDGVCDSDDLCPNGDDAIDSDADGVPDGCDPCPLDLLDDSDADGVCDSSDMCPGEDDVADADGDAIPDACDNCVTTPNIGQADSDLDAVGDACDICALGDDTIDSDVDGVPDDCDPCPLDLLDDSDNDGVCDSSDVCPGGDDGADADADGVPDGCDICALGDDSVDGDGDGTPDACDPCPMDLVDDSDGDGVCESSDVCPGEDDGADADADGVPDACDNCPADPNADQIDDDDDTFGLPCDCNDLDDSVVVRTGPEICDGVDNDCDGAIDDPSCDGKDDGCAGCDGTGQSGAPMLALMVALLVTRRRGS